jgi:hypothetical protein
MIGTLSTAEMTLANFAFSLPCEEGIQKSEGFQEVI